MSIIDFYKSIEKVSYKEYLINDDHNILLLTELEKLKILFDNNAINFYITGGVSYLFFYKKIYRNIKDIDIIIQPQYLLKILELLKYDFNLCSRLEISPVQELKDFKLNKNDTLRLQSVNKKYMLDLINYDNHMNNYMEPSKKIYIANFGKFRYYYMMPPKLYNNRWKREKDIEDVNIFNAK